MIRRFLADQSGATSIEYALIASLIFLVIIVSVTTLGNETKNTFNAVANGFPDP